MFKAKVRPRRTVDHLPDLFWYVRGRELVALKVYLVQVVEHSDLCRQRHQMVVLQLKLGQIDKRSDLWRQRP